MKEKIAKCLLETQAVFLRPEEPFTWASGIKSPIYCDNRVTLAFPSVRVMIAQGLANLIKEHFSSCEVIMGTATAGIAHATSAANILDLPMGYVRASSKDHGRVNQIEGKIIPKQKVVVVEDLISTAGSVIEVVKALQENDFEVLGIVSIFTYGLQKGKERLKAANMLNYSLCDFETLIKVASEENYIVKNSLAGLLKFQQNPNDPTWQNSF